MDDASKPAGHDYAGSAYLARLAAERRARPASRLMRVLDTVPDDQLRAFSRAWNRTCAAIVVCGGAAIVAILLAG